jgi:hypothetical protein
LGQFNPVGALAVGSEAASMPGLVELAYTTGGGVIGAALTNYFSRNQERRQLRAAVMRELHRVAADTDDGR